MAEPSENRSPIAHRQTVLVVAVLAVAANLAVVVGGPALVTFAAGFTLMCLLPGYLLAWLVLPGLDAVDGLERPLLGVALGYAAMILGGLALHYVPGPITPGLILVGFDLLLAALLVIAWLRLADMQPRSVPRYVVIQVLAVLALGAILRLPDIGYSELQGDEATIALKSAAAVQGRDDVLFIHKKGPAEILMPTMVYGLAGRLDETTARLPFALATLAGLAALYQLGRAMFSPRVGLVAGLILSVNGFFVGFGRIVQYQGVVFFMSVMALLMAYRWYQDRPPPSRFLFLTGFLTAVGIMAHYDAVFALPPILFLAVGRWHARPSALRLDVRTIAVTSAVCAVVLAAFFVPMVRHPYFSETTWRYLFELRVTGESEGSLHNTLGNAYVLSTYYSASYYMALLALGLLTGITTQLAKSFGRGVGLTMGVVIGLGSATLVALPEVWRLGANSLAVLFLLVVTALLLVLRRTTSEWKTQLVWLAVPLVLYTAVVESPRTHFHVVFPAMSVLVAVALIDVYVLIRVPIVRRAAAVAFAGVLAVSASYAHLMFVQHEPEYRRTIPSADAIDEGSPVSSEPQHPTGFWRPDIELPSNGWFGFPYRAGWKAIGQLYEDGRIQGTYWSNEEQNVTNWYTRGAPRCDLGPRYYIIAHDVQDVRPFPPLRDLGQSGYGARHQILLDDGDDISSRIVAYERDWLPLATENGLKVAHVQLADMASRFDRGTNHPWFEPGLPYFSEIGYVPEVVGARFDDKAYLEGYALEPGNAGGELILTLYWRAEAAMDKDYSVFVHLVDGDDESATYAQSDGAPGVCGEQVPTTTWQPGRIYVDRRVLTLPADMPAGMHKLLVGLYDYETLLRLPIVNESGPYDDHVRIHDVDVGGAPDWSAGSNP